MRGLKDKTAIVTGAASGIGKAIAGRLGEEGCKVAILDLNGDGAQATAADIQAAGGTAFAYQTDITDRTSVAASVEQVERDAGPIGILVNNAGWDLPTGFLESDREFWDKVIAINLYGPLNMHHVVLPRMIENGGGRVVNIASDAGRVGSSGEAVYSACKGGIIAFSKTLARENARHKITLNTVCPGPTDTPLFDDFKAHSPNGAKIAEGLARAIPLRRLGEPADYPGMVAFLASEDAAYITGQVISVSGGLTMSG
jgi:2-hydroxycyclohexanecarboxyl-CoA dehydrogenase